MKQLRWFLWILALQIPAAASAEVRLEGDVTVQPSPGPEHPGLWEYTVRFEWELPAAAFGPIDVWLPLEDCDCRCEDNLIRFSTPAGFASTFDSVLPCNAELVGTYDCADATSTGRPLVRFSIAAQSVCPPGAAGNGELKFFSIFGPGPETTRDAISTRAAGVSVTGRLTGALPSCVDACVALPVEERAWSMIKSIYR